MPANLKLVKSSLNDIKTYLNTLDRRLREEDSKILITGDVNSGKSTFINTLLRRNIVPHDQQPCTNAFVQIIDATQNNMVEEVHAVKAYPGDDSSYDIFSLDKLRELAEDEELHSKGYSLLKVYCLDHREKTDSLLHNDIVNISLIDSPGLNIDTCKTTTLFTKQQEIDVVCFVVNAENHFTLSGMQFLEQAVLEKEWVFIVVNKFDLIKRRDRCQKAVLDQLRSVSRGMKLSLTYRYVF
jgi:mitofusin